METDNEIELMERLTNLQERCISHVDCDHNDETWEDERNRMIYITLSIITFMFIFINVITCDATNFDMVTFLLLFCLLMYTNATNSLIVQYLMNHMETFEIKNNIKLLLTAWVLLISLSTVYFEDEPYQIVLELFTRILIASLTVITLVHQYNVYQRIRSLFSKLIRKRINIRDFTKGEKIKDNYDANLIVHFVISIEEKITRIKNVLNKDLKVNLLISLSFAITMFLDQNNFVSEARHLLFISLNLLLVLISAAINITTYNYYLRMLEAETKVLLLMSVSFLTWVPKREFLIGTCINSVVILARVFINIFNLESGTV